MKMEDEKLSALLKEIETYLRLEEVFDEEVKNEIKKGLQETLGKYKERIEQECLSQQYADRLELPTEQWETKPNGMTTGEWFKQR